MADINNLEKYSLGKLETPDTDHNSNSPEHKDLAHIEKRREVATENTQELQKQTLSNIKAHSKKTTGHKKVTTNTADIKAMDNKRKVETLSMIAFEKGIAHSIKIARQLKDPYVLDALHDKLVGDLYEKLVEQGKIKKI